MSTFSLQYPQNLRAYNTRKKVKDHPGVISLMHSRILQTSIEGAVLTPVLRMCFRNRQSCTFMIFDRVCTNSVLKSMTNLHENEQFSDHPCSLAISISGIFSILGENLHLLNSTTTNGLHKLTRSLSFLVSNSQILFYGLKNSISKRCRRRTPRLRTKSETECKTSKTK